jgi:hypothetical protein
VPPESGRPRTFPVVSDVKKPRKKKRPSKRVLALPDLEQSKRAVLSTLTSKIGQRSYDRVIADSCRLVLFRTAPALSH